ncbi:serine/threonine-protein kinase EDR1-like [Papaver somniferum]|uniref:serine/threonine-protein kinase EDR1-like n=1 Tax=Papaver somniferum TaxID=3469 RepID=UPI000E6FD835|nr:serine/threonine-protein kinase EDR1-like [Papaver somniferum]
MATLTCCGASSGIGVDSVQRPGPTASCVVGRDKTVPTWNNDDSASSKHKERSIHECLNHRSSNLNFTDKQSYNILQSMGQAIHIYDDKGVIIYWNRAAEDLYGYSASEAVGHNGFGLIVEKHAYEEGKEIILKNAMGESWTGLFPVINKQGRRFRVMETTSPFYDDCGTLIGFISVTCDSQIFHETQTTCTSEREPSKEASYDPNSIQLSKRGAPVTNGLMSQQKPFQVAIPSKLFTLQERLFGDFGDEDKIGDCKIITGRVDGIFLPREGGRQDTSMTKTTTHGIYPAIRRELKDDFHQQKSQESNLFSGSKACSYSSSSSNRSHTSSTVTSGSRSSSSTSSSSTPRCSDMETDSLSYGILWGDLILCEQIGTGSCATVYHGLWCGSDVAVKVFSEFEYSEDLLRTFRHEDSLMKRFRHPNVLLFMGAVTSAKHLCIVTEFLPRGSLFQLLRRNPPALDWKRRVLMALDIAQGLNYFHCYNPPIVHRNLKSSNLLVDNNWKLKIGDFGLSRIKHATFLTTKSGKGTPQWMAPEVIRNEPADEKCDVYSFGVVLWELATGKIPWDGLTPTQVIAAVGFMDQGIEIPKNIDPQWASLIKTCLHIDPKCRPTFGKLLEKLNAMRRYYFAPN